MATDERSTLERSPQERSPQARAARDRPQLLRMAMLVIATLLALTLGAATACSSSSDSSTRPGPDMLTTMNLEGKWSLIPPDPVPAGPSNPLQIEFTADKKFGFYGGCNQSGGKFTITDGRVVLTEAASTTKGCTDPGWILADPLTFVLSDNGTVLTVGTTVGDQQLQRVDSFTD
jgi:heat shock protein HslJ